MCPVGDVWSNNRIIAAYLESESDYQTSAAWDVTTTSHGSIGTSTTTAVGEGNQFVGSAPYGWPGEKSRENRGQIIGGDETTHTLVRAPAPDSTDDQLNFTRLYGPTCAGINRAVAGNPNYIFNAFYISCKSHEEGGPFAAHVGPGSMNDEWIGLRAAGRVIFSPDGEHWGVCFALNLAGTSPAVFFGDSIIIGCPFLNPSPGIRSIPIPTHTVQRPLALGCGGRNLLATVSHVVPSDAGSNTTIAIGTSDPVANGLPAGVPLPPCNVRTDPNNPNDHGLKNVFRCTVPIGSASHYLAVFKLTADAGIAASSKIKARIWVYPLAWAGTAQPIATCWVARAALGMYSGAGATPSVSMANSREEFTLGAIEAVGDPVRGWFPITLDTDSSASQQRWKTDAQVNASPQTSFPLGLRLTSRKLHTVINEGTGPQPPNPTDFLIAMDYVLADAPGETPVEKEHPGVALPQPGGTTVYADESATIGGFDCNTATKDWTIELAGDVPDDAWDQTDVNRPLNKVLFTLMKSGVPWATVEIVQNGVYSPGALRLRFSNGGTHTLAGNTDSPFCFLRGSQVLVTLRHKSGGQWSIFASVGGSTVAKAVELSGPEVLPEVLRFGDNANTHVEPMLWYGGRIWEGEGRTDEQITDSMRTLGMLYAKNVLTPPGL